MKLAHAVNNSHKFKVQTEYTCNNYEKTQQNRNFIHHLTIETFIFVLVIILNKVSILFNNNDREKRDLNVYKKKKNHASKFFLIHKNLF